MVTRRDMGVSFAPAKRAVWPRPRRELGAGRWPVPAAARTAHRGLAAAGLACLLEHLGDEALAPVLRGAGGTRKSSSRRSVMAALPASLACPVVRSTRTCLHWRGPSRHAARRRSRCVPRHPMCRLAFGPPGAASFVLPSAFALRCRSRVTAARWRCCVSSQRAGERGHGRRPGAFEARRLHVGRLRWRQRDVRCEYPHCTRDDMATEQQNERPMAR